MPTIQRSALLPYPAESLFALVDDIEAYPQFMDGCVGAEVLKREGDIVEARLDLSRGGLSQSFATRNRNRCFSSIEMELLEGPFERFGGEWRFDALDDAACKVSLDLEFAFNNRLLGVAASRLFEGVTNSLVDAVSRRARQVYG